VQGQVSDIQNPTADATKDYRYWIFTPYIDDQWKVTSKLTVNLGLRYSPTTMIGEIRHQMYNLINPTVPGGEFVPVKTSTATNPSLRNWDPRIGLAWDPFADHKTSVRASFGMFHNVVYSRDLNYWLQPPFLTATQTSAQGLLYPNLFSNLGPGANVVNVPTGGTLSITNGDYYGVHSTPYQMQWNFNIDREIVTNTVFTIGYIGTHNLHMFIPRDFNYPVPCLAPNSGCFYNGAPTYSSAAGVPNPRLDPQYNSLQLADNLAASHYEALQTSVDHRFSHGWQMQVSYTYSKSIDNGSGTYGLDGGGISSQPLNAAVDRGLSNFNRTNNFRVSGVYNLPYHGHGFTGEVLGGWERLGARGSVYVLVRRSIQRNVGPEPCVYRYRLQHRTSQRGGRMQPLLRLPNIERMVQTRAASLCSRSVPTEMPAETRSSVPISGIWTAPWIRILGFRNDSIFSSAPKRSTS
jgi:hypothetical protein